MRASIEGWVGACAVVLALAPSAWAGDGPPAPTREEAKRAAGSVGTWVPIDGTDRLVWNVSMPVEPADGAPPPPPPPGAPRPSEGVTVYGQPPQGPVTYVPTNPYEPYSPSGLMEDRRIGPARQPEWTTDRRFTRVRTYVLAPWQVEFESWYYGKTPKDEDTTHLFQEEISVGLPHRFQVDIYANIEKKPDEDVYYKATQVEARWALANWDCLPLNPTLYAEWKFQTQDQPDVGEFKLLLSDNISPRWIFGVNFAYERETSGEEEEVFAANAGISYSVIDSRLAIGAEAQVERATVLGARDDPSYEYLLGPSVQVRFNSWTHLDITPLFGLTDDSPDMKLYIVFGIDIGGPRGHEGGWLNPTAGRSR